MDLPDKLLDGGWYWVAWVIWAPLVVRSALRAPWGRLKESGHLNLWLGLVVTLTLLWSLKAGIKPGLALHLLGATVCTLSFGPALAFIALNLVLAAVTLNGGAGWGGFALNALLMGGVGVAASQGIYRLADRFLPPNLFIYIFANGFFGAALAVLAVGVSACMVFVLGGVYSVDYLLAEYLPYTLLLGFAEAWLSGMTMTLLVVYFPGWVATFDDSRYLANK